MFFIILIISIIIFLKTLSYGIYEMKINNNKPAGIVIIFLASIVLIFAPLVTWFR